MAFWGERPATSGSSVNILNDLWKYDPATNQWTWVKGDSTANNAGVYGAQGTAAPTNKPGSREGSISWTDASGNLWLFGRYASQVGVLNDLWKYNPSTNQWTWVKGDSTANSNGIYGTQGTAAPTNKPGAREISISWRDAAGNFWLFGGFGYPSSGTYGKLNDLWKYDPSTNQWTWVKGDNTINRGGIYGTQGTAASTNKPGARQASISWTDAAGNLWLFGGAGYDATATDTRLNDLWKYDPATNQWTWVKGDNTNFSNGVYGTEGVYGTQGIAAPTNKPGSRQQAISWTDASGSLWLFGGYGNTTATSQGLLNDLWKYDPATNQWTWVKGNNTPDNIGVYGIQGTAASTNRPGGRNFSIPWQDAFGNFWLYGGNGYANKLFKQKDWKYGQILFTQMLLFKSAVYKPLNFNYNYTIARED